MLAFVGGPVWGAFKSYLHVAKSHRNRTPLSQSSINTYHSSIKIFLLTYLRDEQIDVLWNGHVDAILALERSRGNNANFSMQQCAFRHFYNYMEPHRPLRLKPFTKCPGCLCGCARCHGGLFTLPFGAKRAKRAKLTAGKGSPCEALSRGPKGTFGGPLAKPFSEVTPFQSHQSTEGVLRRAPTDGAAQRAPVTVESRPLGAKRPLELSEGPPSVLWKGVTSEKVWSGVCAGVSRCFGKCSKLVSSCKLNDDGICAYCLEKYPILYAHASRRRSRYLEYVNDHALIGRPYDPSKHDRMIRKYILESLRWHDRSHVKWSYEE